MGRYNTEAGFVDEVNKEILMGFPDFTITRWKLKYLITILMGIINNARRFKMIHHGIHIPMKDWLVEVANTLCPTKEGDQNHLIVKNDSPKRQSCKICYSQGKPPNKTTYHCSTCQADMCIKCWGDKNHILFSHSLYGLKIMYQGKYLQVG